MRTARHWTGLTLRPKAPERPPGASAFHFPDGRGEPRRTQGKVEHPRDAGRTPGASVFRFPDGREETTRTAAARCGKGAPPRSGGFFPGDRGSFSERTVQDRYPAYTVATATKGTSGC